MQEEASILTVIVLYFNIFIATTVRNTQKHNIHHTTSRFSNCINNAL